MELMQKFCLCPVTGRDNKQSTAVYKMTNGLLVFPPLDLRIIRTHRDSIVCSFIENDIVAASQTVFGQRDAISGMSFIHDAAYLSTGKCIKLVVHSTHSFGTTEHSN